MILFADTGVAGNDDLYIMRSDGRDITRVTHSHQLGERRGVAAPVIPAHAETWERIRRVARSRPRRAGREAKPP
jgi:hypothetical protein